MLNAVNAVPLLIIQSFNGPPQMLVAFSLMHTSDSLHWAQDFSATDILQLAVPLH